MYFLLTKHWLHHKQRVSQFAERILLQLLYNNSSLAVLMVTVTVGIWLFIRLLYLLWSHSSYSCLAQTEHKNTKS